MPEQPAAERTEQPTGRRLQKAREKGQVPHSAELTSAVTLLGLVVAVALTGPTLLGWFAQKMKLGLAGETSVFGSSDAFMEFVGRTIVDSALVVLPVLCGMALACVLAGVAVSGFNFTPGAVRLRLNQINPANALQNMFKARTAVRLLTSIAKLFFVCAIVWLYLRSKLDVLATLRWAWSLGFVTEVARLLFGLCIRVGVALLAIGIADVFFQKWQHIQDLKMTRQEVRQERRDIEGSPEVRMRVRQIQLQMAMKRFLQEVPKADVILVNPTHVAVALRYEAKTMEAPMLLAKGADHLAQKIIKIGRSYGIPVVRRPELARAIYGTVEPGHPIPQALYVAVAEVLAMLYRLRQKKKASLKR